MAEANVDSWDHRNMQPMLMQDMARWWMDSLKVLGAGNGTGVIAAGAALNSFSAHPHVLFPLKLSACSFFIGVFAFAVAFWYVNLALMVFDDYLQEVRSSVAEKNAKRIKDASPGLHSSSLYMGRANWLAILGFAAFIFGSLSGVWALLRL